jgi:transposase
MGQSHSDRGGNASRHGPTGKSSAPQGIADWRLDGVGKKRGHPVPDPERKRVASLFAQGITVLDAMDVCVGIGLTSMYKFKRQYDAVGHCDAGLHGKPPKKYRTLRTGHKMFLLMAIALSLTPTARQWAEVLEEEFGLDIGEEAVRRDMHESGLTKVVAAPMDERAFLPHHIQSAAEWELLRPTLPAKKIVWIDETGKKPSDMEPVRLDIFAVHSFETLC